MLIGLMELLQIILGGALLMLALIGFRYALSLRPHERESRPAPAPLWWYTRVVTIQLDGDDGSGAGAISAKRVMRMTGKMPTATISSAASAPSSKLPRVAN